LLTIIYSIQRNYTVYILLRDNFSAFEHIAPNHLLLPHQKRPRISSASDRILWGNSPFNLI
jgi:hypothetical protein